MDDMQQGTTDAAVSGPTRPEPCAPLVAGGALVTILGLGVLLLGRYMYVEAGGTVGVLVLGALVAVAGLSVLLVGMFRAAAALDYLVRTR